jgi:hypothetical protein
MMRKVWDWTKEIGNSSVINRIGGSRGFVERWWWLTWNILDQSKLVMTFGGSRFSFGPAVRFQGFPVAATNWQVVTPYHIIAGVTTTRTSAFTIWKPGGPWVFGFFGIPKARHVRYHQDIRKLSTFLSFRGLLYYKSTSRRDIWSVLP